MVQVADDRMETAAPVLVQASLQCKYSFVLDYFPYCFGVIRVYTRGNLSITIYRVVNGGVQKFTGNFTMEDQGMQ